MGPGEPLSPSVRTRYGSGGEGAAPSLHGTARVHDLHDAAPLDAHLGASPRMLPRPSSMPPAMRMPAESTPLAYRPTMRPPAAPRQRPAPSLVQQLALPVACILFACGLTITDLVMKSSGPGLSFGPVRSLWVASVLLLLGVGLFFWRMIGDPDDA